MREAVNFVMHEPEELKSRLRIVDRALFQGLDQRLQRRERCPQLMRKHGHKIVFGATVALRQYARKLLALQ